MPINYPLGFCFQYFYHMTYNELVEYFKAICLDINPNGSFVHGRRVDGSINYDLPLPQIHLYPFTSNKDILNQTVTYNIVMGFWEQDAHDNTLDTRQEIISRMDALCTAFQTRLNNDALGVIASGRDEPQYLTLTGTLSGYAFTCNFTTTLAC